VLFFLLKDGNLSRLPLSILFLLLGTNTLLFSVLVLKMLLLFVRTSGYLSFDSLDYFFVAFGGIGTKFIHLCSDYGITMVCMRLSIGTTDSSGSSFMFFMQRLFNFSAEILFFELY